MSKKNNLFQTENNFFASFENKQKQTITPKRTTKEGLWPSEVALQGTSPDP